jgi:hypothetical protein
MKRNINGYQRLIDKGSNLKEKSSFTIDVKWGEKNRGMKTRGTIMNTSVSIVVSKCCHQCQRARLLKD